MRPLVHRMFLLGRSLVRRFLPRGARRALVRATRIPPVGDNPRANYVDDLAVGRTLPDAAFDCIVCTQTLHVIPDMVPSVRTLARILKPGGVLLATAPGISQIYRDEEGRWGDYWRLTDRSAVWLMEQGFGPGATAVEVRGNVLSAMAFLQGLASEELTPEELDARDPDYQVSLGIRVVRPVHDPFGLCVSPENFAAHMEIVAGLARPTSLRSLAPAPGGLQSRSVAITFDDASEDVLTEALPVLERWGVPATVFAVSDVLGTTFWWDRMTRIPLQAAADYLESGCPRRPDGQEPKPAGTFGRLHARLLPLARQERDRVILRLSTAAPWSKCHR